MKAVSSNNLQVGFGFVVIAALALIGWWLLTTLSSTLLGLDKAVASTIIAGLVTIFSVLFTYWKERKKSFQESHREKKIEIYSIFFNFITGAIEKIVKETGEVDYKDSTFVDGMLKLKKGLLFYGSPGVIKAFNQFQGMGDREPHEAVEIVGNILLEMRKDIGLSNFGLTSIELQSIYVRDYRAGPSQGK